MYEVAMPTIHPILSFYFPTRLLLMVVLISCGGCGCFSHPARHLRWQECPVQGLITRRINTLQGNDVIGRTRAQCGFARCGSAIVVPFPKGIVHHSSVAKAYRHTVPQVGQSKGGPAITAVGGAEQGKQGLVLSDGQHLPVAKRPAPGGEVAGEK